jgi:hypothetical protein
LVSVRAVEDQVTRKGLLRQHLAARGVLRTRRPRQLDADTGIRIQHETGCVESDGARHRVQSDDMALPVETERIVRRAAAAGRSVGIAAAEGERHSALREAASDHVLDQLLVAERPGGVGERQTRRRHQDGKADHQGVYAFHASFHFLRFTATTTSDPMVDGSRHSYFDKLRLSGAIRRTAHRQCEAVP